MRRPSLVIITDRRLAGADLLPRLTVILDAVPPGAALVQVREKDLDARALLALVRDVVAVAHPRGASVLVNDRLDVALAAGADGVHLPETGIDIATARHIALVAGHPRILVGISRHSAESSRTAAAAGADVVLLGPIFATPSKAGMGAPLGVTAIREARAAWPRDGGALVAIGGIETAARAAEVRRAGATGVAAIRAFWTSPDPAAIARAFTLDAP